MSISQGTRASIVVGKQQGLQVLLAEMTEDKSWQELEVPDVWKAAPTRTFIATSGHGTKHRPAQRLKHFAR
jgi:hypothetical protein